MILFVTRGGEVYFSVIVLEAFRGLLDMEGAAAVVAARRRLAALLSFDLGVVSDAAGLDVAAAVFHLRWFLTGCGSFIPLP